MPDPISIVNGKCDGSGSKIPKRYTEIDVAKGIAILLVVFGHLTQGYTPNGHGWYSVVQRVIYDFHMPLFMFLSGFVFHIIAEKKLEKDLYFIFIKDVLWRMLPGWLFIGILVISLKIFLGSTLGVNNQVDIGVEAYLKIFYLPGYSGARSLWYVHTLIMLYIIFSAGLIYLPYFKLWNFPVAISLTIIAIFINISPYLALDRIFFYSGYFAFGVFTYGHWSKFRSICNRYFLLWALLFAVTFFDGVEGWYAGKSISGIFGIPFIMGLVSFLKGRIGKFFEYIGSYTFTIYLFNTLAIGMVITVFRKLKIFEGQAFYLYLLVAMTLGSLGCILGYRVFCLGFPKLSKFFK